MKKLETALLCIVLVLPWSLFISLNMVPMQFWGKADYGEPYRFAANQEYWAPITNYAVTRDHIYVLFDGKSILKCYTKDGTYLHSFYFKQGNNGSAHLRFANNRLFLTDRENNLYELNGAEIVSYYAFEDRAVWEQEIEISYADWGIKGFGENIDDYSLRFGSLWKTEDDSDEVCLIQRPLWAILANDVLLFSLGLSIPLLLSGLDNLIKRLKNRTK